MRRLNPSTIHPPFANYAHGVEIDPGARIVFCSGQLGIGRDGAIPESVEAQAHLCFRAIVGDPRRGRHDARPTWFDSTPMCRAAEYLGGYMKVRDQFVSTPPPASTLMVVQGFARPEFKVEIEAVAARAP